MIDDNFEEKFDFDEEEIPTAEVEAYMPEQPLEPESGREASPPEPPLTDSEQMDSENFVPSETRTWRYCLRDSSDEIFWGLVFLMVIIVYWFDIPLIPPDLGKVASHVLNVIFAIGIVYYSVFLFSPFKIFNRKKGDLPDPNANSVWYDAAVFLFFVVSVLALINRLIVTMIPGNMPAMLDVFWQVVFILFSVFVLGNAWYLLVQIFLARICTYYRLTPVLFIMKTGFFITKERRIAVWDIAQVNMMRNLWQRFLGVGTIELKIHSHGMDGTGSTQDDLARNARILHLKGLSNPEEVLDTINHYRLFVRNHMGQRFMTTITSEPQKGVKND